MARLGGINVPDHKHLVISLTHIYGIGLSRAQLICNKTKINPAMKVGELNSGQLEDIRTEITKFEIEGDLRRQIQMDIKRLQDLGTLRGIRHRKRLPVRGQRTRTNARTRKGPKRPIRS